MDEVEVLVAHNERATLRVGDVFLKIDAGQARIDVEVAAEIERLYDPSAAEVIEVLPRG